VSEKRPLFRKGDQGPAVAEICDRLLRIGAITKPSNVIDETVDAAIKEELMGSLVRTPKVLLKNYKKIPAFQLMEFVVQKFSKQLKD